MKPNAPFLEKKEDHSVYHDVLMRRKLTPRSQENQNYCFRLSDQCQITPTQEDHIMEEIVNLRENIKSLDPLGADSVFSQLPKYNADKNVQQIIAATTSLLPHVEAVFHFD